MYPLHEFFKNIIENRAWGMGHGAWGMGHGAWSMGEMREVLKNYSTSLSPSPSKQELIRTVLPSPFIEIWTKLPKDRQY